MRAKSAEVSQFLTGSMHHGAHPAAELDVLRAIERGTRNVAARRELPRLGARLQGAAVGTMQLETPQPRTTTRSQHR